MTFFNYLYKKEGIFMIKGKKAIAYLMSLLLLLSLFIPQQSALAAESGIEMQFNNGNAGTNSNTINAKFKVVNKGGSSINLSQLKLRYYYTKDADKSQNFYCDYSGMMSGGAHSNMTNKVTGSIVNMSKSVATADTYIEIGFTSDAGSLAAGGTIEVQTRVSRSDWSNYDQSNDYSYKLAGSDVVWDQVAAFLNSTIVFGKSPSDEQQVMNPEISTKTATFDKYTPSNIKITLTPNGNSFVGITGLKKGTDYTVSGNAVTILGSYLSTLSLGSKTLTFDFGAANNPQLALTIKDSTPSGDGLDVTLATVTGNKGDTVTVPVTFANVAKVGNIITCNFYLSYNPSLLEAISVTAGDIVTNPSINFASKINESSSIISFLFLDDTVGDGLITEDGVFANIKFKILGNAGQTANVKFTEEGAFGDSDMERITNMKFTDGGVVISSTSTENPTISPNNSTFDKYTPSNIKITLTPNGNSFVGITGLKKGTDYTVSGNTVTILGSYLSTLSLGSKTLTFDFGAANNPQLALTIKDSTPSGDGLGLEVATVSCNENDTVTVPVTMTNASKVGNIGAYGFAVTYDSTLLKPISITDGDLLANKGLAKTVAIDGGIGMLSRGSKAVASEYVRPIYLSFNSFESQEIKEDGVLVYIEFEILGKAGDIAAISIDRNGVFENGESNIITDVSYTDGLVVITGDEQLDPSITPITASFDKYSPSDITVTMISNENTFSGIIGLVKGRDYSVSSNTVKIFSSYLSSLELGSKSLTFDFGVTANPSIAIRIEDTTPVETDFNVRIGKVSGNTGDTVNLPVTLGNISKVGSVITCNFYMTYDTSLLEAISVTAGDIVINPSINFDSRINNGTISILFLDNTIGDELITEDGEMLTITFKILGTKSKETFIVFQEDGAFGDGNMERIDDMKKIDGSITIN
jgi:hypothetical protein